MSRTSQKWLLEVLWIVIAALLAIAVAAAPYLRIGTYPFLIPLALITFGLVSILRLLFFYQQTPLLKAKAAKGMLCVAVIPVILFTVLAINNVQNYVDAEGYGKMFSATETETFIAWGKYVRDATVFLGSGLIISALVLPIILIIGIWKQVKDELKVKNLNRTS